ncbi:MarR family winged helix-turn-helix transcriptional regulator [Microbacterium indicum]|uniref:MarR family winged helix-turn-helix transcriptional regulator n=1 Tax=Microbacterium indicum TaxID=358100 RepID=UPI0003FC8877|nr:MarR family winged helix-turn-helix transcriptional regulator [Microbacterium indicum]
MTRQRGFTDEERGAWAPFAALLELLPHEIDAQLVRDEGITHFDYFAMAVLRRAPGHTMRASELASHTSATLPRMSHALKRLEARGFVERAPAADDARATQVTLTYEGRRKVIGSTPSHVENVRNLVLDALTEEQKGQLQEIVRAILPRVDPDARMAATRGEM